VLYQLRHPGTLLGIALALVVGLLLHDLAQTLVARATGDETPTRAGRAAPRLLPHVDPFGAVAAVLVGWGWGSATPLDERWRARRWRVVLALGAGPATYLLLAFLGALFVRLVVTPDQVLQELPGRFCLALTFTWAALAVVSLLPVPPLDGGRVVLALAPQTLAWQRIRQQLEERNLGTVVALVLVVVPRLFPGFPDVVAQLLSPLLDGLGGLVGVRGLGSTADVVRLA